MITGPLRLGSEQTFFACTTRMFEIWLWIRPASRPNEPKSVPPKCRAHILAAVRLFTCQRAIQPVTRQSSLSAHFHGQLREAKSYRSFRLCQQPTRRKINFHERQHSNSATVQSPRRNTAGGR